MGLAELVRAELVLVAPSATTDEGIISQLAARLTAQGFARPSLAAAVIERERSHPTGLVLDAAGGNAAIPHADPGHVVLPAVAVGVLATPVDFKRMDAPAEVIPVRLVLLLALADPEAQLATLREVGALLQDPARIAALTAAETPDQVVALLGGTS